MLTHFFALMIILVSVFPEFVFRVLVSNEPDLEEVPAEVRDALTIHFVSRLDQVLELALDTSDLAKDTGAAPAAPAAP